MYTTFFGFKENPFNLTPDPRYLFLSQYHKEALDHLLYGINERKGFIAITGGIGTGKTTICRALLSQLDSSLKSALIFNSFISDGELLKTINQEFGIEMDPAAESKKDYVDALNRFLLDNFSNGGNAVLLIDEAQNLSHSVLEQIRMLSNLETEREKLIQIILVGQPELREILLAPSLKQLNERISVRYDLRPLHASDIKGYVEHRLVVAGSRGDLRFTDGAIKKIFAYSRGNPRRINAVCDRALLIAYAVEKRSISKRMVGRAIKEVRGDLKADSPLQFLFDKRFGYFAFFALLLIVAAAIGGWAYQTGKWKLISGKQRTTEINHVQIPRKPVQPKKKGAALFFDEKSSLSRLLRLFNESQNTAQLFSGKNHVRLISLAMGQEFLGMFKKPFRIQYSDALHSSFSSGHYLLVRKLTDEGAIIVDMDGKEHLVVKDFLIKNWGTEISWFYPQESEDEKLSKEMASADVLTVQTIMHKAGYPIELNGHFDEATLHGIAELQKDFGLTEDGTVGPKTMAVLYLMSE